MALRSKVLTVSFVALVAAIVVSLWVLLPGSRKVDRRTVDGIPKLPTEKTTKDPSPSPGEGIGPSTTTTSIESPQSRTSIPVTPQELAERTALTAEFQKAYQATSFRVQAELNSAGNFRSVLTDEVYALKDLVGAIALVRALRDPALRPQLYSILSHSDSLQFTAGLLEPVVEGANLPPDLVHPKSAQHLDVLLARVEPALQQEYVSLTGKLDLSPKLTDDAVNMFSHRILLRIISADMQYRGYSWNEGTMQFAPISSAGQ